MFSLAINKASKLLSVKVQVQKGFSLAIDIPMAPDPVPSSRSEQFSKSIEMAVATNISDSGLGINVLSLT